MDFISKCAFKKLDFLYRSQTLIESSAVDPDSMGPCIRIRIQEGKNDTQT